jgi:flagellar biosynthesis protein FlhB
MFGRPVCRTTVSIRIVADCVVLYCQIKRKLDRVTTVNFSTISAIKYTACWLLCFFIFTNYIHYFFKHSFTFSNPSSLSERTNKISFASIIVEPLGVMYLPFLLIIAIIAFLGKVKSTILLFTA